MHHRRHALWATLGALIVLVHGACGSDDSGSKGGADTGDASTGGDAGSSDDGGAAGGAGTGGAGAGTGGRAAGGTGGSGGGARADGGPDAGPSCTPLEDIPAPVQTTLDAAPACIAPTPCGGELDGTSWAYLDVCVDEDVVFAETFAECPTAQLNGIGDRSLSGTLSFQGGIATHRATIAGTGVFQIPNECHACGCKDFQEVTLYNMGVSAFCYEDCYPDLSCRCLIAFQIEVDESETYEAAGDTVTLAGGRTYDYCASADRLSLSETSASPLVPGTAALVPPSALDTPEICDGQDNDHDGTVDDEPVDCATPCIREGVCAEVNVVCNGAWSCEYTSTARELGEETRCDGLDNDCDGEVDEGLTGCVELCDGLDNDNDGTVDDNPVDSACPVARGVCTAGVQAVCAGASGWQCSYTSAVYRPTEAQCDGQDNDCDGMIDEGCRCTTGTSKLFVLRKGAANAGVMRANLDGTSPELILPLQQNFVFDIAVDPVNEKLYFYDFGVEALRRANLDGSSVETVWSGKTQMFAIDPGTPQRGFVENDIYSIRAFALASPAGITTIVQPASVVAFAVDPVNQQLYWSDHGGTWPNGIMRAGYDGSNPVGVFGSSFYFPFSLAVDPVNRRLYYSGAMGIHSVKLNGEDERVDLAPSGQNAGPFDVALDLAGGKMYVSEDGADRVRRANLDGTNVEPVLSGADVEGAEAIALYVCAP